MYSTFLVSKTACMVCNNQLLKSLGTLQGIFEVEMDRIDGRIVVSHTDEVSREDIATLLTSLGFPEREREELNEENNEPPVCECSL